jgi:hypothetical protein
VKSTATALKETLAAHRDIPDEILTVWRTFEGIRSDEGEAVTQTPARHQAIGHALRRGYTVEECEQAIEHAHVQFYGENRLVCDLPHCLHADRIDAAIFDDLLDGDWWFETPF